MSSAGVSLVTLAGPPQGKQLPSFKGVNLPPEISTQSQQRLKSAAYTSCHINAIISIVAFKNTLLFRAETEGEKTQYVLPFRKTQT